MSTVSRVECPHCGAQCMEQESLCWQCGKGLKASPAPPRAAPEEPAAQQPAPAKRDAAKPGGILGGILGRNTGPPPPAQAEKPLIQFEPGASAAEQEPARRTVMTLAGEVVEVEDAAETATLRVNAAPAERAQPGQSMAAGEPVAAQIGGTTLHGAPPPEIMRLTFCKNCGHQNEEGAKECSRCGKELEMVPLGGVPDVEPLPRAWGFDALGAVWIILGIAAIFCNQFLLKTDASKKHADWADYFWTGVVVCAPGILIFMRHHFCKLLFWVMTLASALVWAVIGFIWITGHLYVSDQGEVGLIWLATLSGLSAMSYFTVRLNDAFDYAS